MIPTDSPNAFATGRNPSHASVAVTRGILEICTDEEIEGVLAHELGHVKNRDIFTSAVVATLAGAITLIARMVYWGELFGGFGGARRQPPRWCLLRSGHDHRGAACRHGHSTVDLPDSREYEADHTGAEITGNPRGLASALQKIDQYSKRIPMQVSPSMAHIYCAQPLTAGEFMGSLFSTHPPIPKRIERLIGRDFV